MLVFSYAKSVFAGNKNWFKKYQKLSIHDKINFKADWYNSRPIHPKCDVWYRVTGLPF